MARTQTKFTASIGANVADDVAIASGSALSATETLALTIDHTGMSRREALDLLERIRTRIIQGTWPPSVPT